MKDGKKEKRVRQIWRAEFRSAEKSVEGTALKTRMGARPLVADHTLLCFLLAPLFVTEPPPRAGLTLVLS